MTSYLTLAQDKTLNDLQEHIQENLVLYSVCIVGFIVVSLTAFLLVKHYRNRVMRQEESIDHLTDFRKMNEDGLLLDKELSNIKKIVSDQQFGGDSSPKSTIGDSQKKNSD